MEEVELVNFVKYDGKHTFTTLTRILDYQSLTIEVQIYVLNILFTSLLRILINVINCNQMMISLH